MIGVHRPNEPLGFPQQRDRWEKEFQEMVNRSRPISSNDMWKRIRQRKIMKEYTNTLFVAFHHKCAFCESKPRHVSPLHIEHYRPKSNSEFQDYMFDWHNWLVACMSCNVNKGEYFADCSGEPCLLDPTAEDPSIHVEFLRAQIIPKTERGKKTIEQIQLNRSELDEARTLWLLHIESLLLLALRIPDVYTQARELLIWAMQEDAPYTAMVRSYLHRHTPKLAKPEIQHPVIQLDEPIRKLTDILDKYREELRSIE